MIMEIIAVASVKIFYVYLWCMCFVTAACCTLTFLCNLVMNTAGDLQNQCLKLKRHALVLQMMAVPLVATFSTAAAHRGKVASVLFIISTSKE